MHIVNIKYGAIVNISKHFYVDMYVGFGLRNKDVVNVNKDFDWNEDYLDLVNHDFFTTYNQEEDSGNHFNVSLGCKFGVRF